MRAFPILSLLFVISFSFKVSDTFAQDYLSIFSQDYGSRLSLEIDPIAYLYKGHSIHIRYQPMFSERFLIGAGTYALDLPDPVIDLNHRNRDQGWDIRIRSAYFIYAELYAREANHGWFVGEQVGFQSFKAANQREGRGATSFNNLLLLTYLGYSWHPYKGSFYVKPWVGLGFTQKVDGVNTVGSMEYDISPLYGFLTFHLGYTF